MSIESDKIFNSQYTDWKCWRKRFGELTASQYNYYQAEIARLRLSSREINNVLEIGFGAGSFLEYSQQKHWHAEGLEVNDELIRMAKRKYISKHVADIDEYPNQFFDLIVAFDVLEHLDVSETSELLIKISKLLKKNGQFLFRVPNGDSPIGLRVQNGDISHKQCIGSAKIIQYAQIAGMSVHFIGPQANPINFSEAKKVLHWIVSTPLQIIANYLMRYLFYQGATINLTSENIIAILSND